MAATLKEIESVWNRLAPSVALKIKFVDELLNDSSRMLELIAVAFSGIAALALIISVLGLIGMSMHVIGRRQHEIGVRKTLGASVGSVVQLLLTDFSKPVIVANLVAWPLAFIVMDKPLDGAVHHQPCHNCACRLDCCWRPSHSRCKNESSQRTTNGVRRIG
jgi:putative ABC transport system permease protein